MQRKQTEASPAGVSARNPLQHIVSLNVCLMHFCDSSKSLHTCSPVSLSRPSWPSPVGRTPMLSPSKCKSPGTSIRQGGNGEAFARLRPTPSSPITFGRLLQPTFRTWAKVFQRCVASPDCANFHLG